jgi:hypothetical protein
MGTKRLPYQHRLLGAPVRVKPRILTIVQNLPVPFDRRVRFECQALVSAAYRFTAIERTAEV